MTEEQKASIERLGRWCEELLRIREIHLQDGDFERAAGCAWKAQDQAELAFLVAQS